MSKLWRKREKVPVDVRDAVALAKGERVLAACRSGDASGYLVASDRALYAVMAPDATRLRWDLIDRAAWQPPFLTVHVYDPGTDRVDSRVFAADIDSDLPSVVRDRVTRTILINNRIEVPGGHARVVGRRDSETGELWWRIVYGTAVDPSDPAVIAAADSELADLRSRMGV